MIQSIRTRSNEPRDADSFGVTDPFPTARARDNANVRARSVSADADYKAQIEKALHDLVVAESWESMTRQSTARSNQTRRANAATAHHQ